MKCWDGKGETKGDSIEWIPPSLRFCLNLGRFSFLFSTRCGVEILRLWRNLNRRWRLEGSRRDRWDPTSIRVRRARMCELWWPFVVFHWNPILQPTSKAWEHTRETRMPIWQETTSGCPNSKLHTVIRHSVTASDRQLTTMTSFFTAFCSHTTFIKLTFEKVPLRLSLLLWRLLLATWSKSDDYTNNCGLLKTRGGRWRSRRQKRRLMSMMTRGTAVSKSRELLMRCAWGWNADVTKDGHKDRDRNHNAKDRSIYYVKCIDSSAFQRNLVFVCH